MAKMIILLAIIGAGVYARDRSGGLSIRSEVPAALNRGNNLTWVGTTQYLRLLSSILYSLPSNTSPLLPLSAPIRIQPTRAVARQYLRDNR